MRKLQAVTSVLACLAVVPAARADVLFIGGTSDLASQYYLSQTYGEIKDNNFNNLQSSGVIQNSGTRIGPSTQSFTLSQSGSSMTANTFAASDAFGQVKASASAQITNSSSNLGYTSIGSYGERTQAQFNSTQTPGRVDFTFTVSGTSSAPFGTTVTRLDFLADASSSGSFFDVFGGSALHATGPGTYTFTYLGSTATPLDIMFYAAAGVLIGSPDYPDAPNGQNFTSFANFSNTFDLTSIQLYTGSNTLITDWTLTDLATNQTVFNQNGRVDAVPEPSSLALLAIGGLGLGLGALGRRRRSPR